MLRHVHDEQRSTERVQGGRNSNKDGDDAAEKSDEPPRGKLNWASSGVPVPTRSHKMTATADSTPVKTGGMSHAVKRSERETFMILSLHFHRRDNFGDPQFLLLKHR